MKNSNYMSFEKNKYFYGKLLSVDDFNLEQRYNNDKRRLGNRFSHGYGIVSGLGVVQVEEDAVSIDSGIAYDHLGREIVVTAPVTKRIPLIEGYDTLNTDGQGQMYLCVDYQEEETGLVHNIAGKHGDKENYNKIKEGYRLFLTQQEPQSPLFGLYDICLDCNTIYQNEGIVIRQYLQRIVEMGKMVKLVVEVINPTRRYISFSYEMPLVGLSQDGRSSVIVEFNEMKCEKKGSYTMELPLMVTASRGTVANISFQAEYFHLFFDQKEQEVEVEDDFLKLQVAKEDLQQEVVDYYFQSGMNRALVKNSNEKLYLARIHFSNQSGMFSIDQIDGVPFKQRVYHAELLGAMRYLEELSMDVSDGGYYENASRETSNAAADRGTSVRLAQGEVWLDMNGGGQRGTRFVTEEITHGLGLGQVHIMVGVEDEDRGVTYGSAEVFENTPVVAETAVRAYPNKGTFQIGVRLISQVIRSGMKLYWTAIADNTPQEKDQAIRKIFIKPGVLELETRQTHYLEAVCTNMTDKSIVWSVKDQGGEITENGVYTAPNTPGVYEISAVSLAYPEVKASIFAVVREG